jgi:hypothetical protein
MQNLYVDQLRKPALVMDNFDDDTPVTPVRATQADGREIRDMEAALRLLPPEQGWARLSARQSWASSGMNL